MLSDKCLQVKQRICDWSIIKLISTSFKQCQVQLKTTLNSSTARHFCHHQRFLSFQDNSFKSKSWQSLTLDGASTDAQNSSSWFLPSFQCKQSFAEPEPICQSSSILPIWQQELLIYRSHLAKLKWLIYANVPGQEQIWWLVAIWKLGDQKQVEAWLWENPERLWWQIPAALQPNQMWGWMSRRRRLDQSRCSSGE